VRPRRLSHCALKSTQGSDLYMSFWKKVYVNKNVGCIFHPFAEKPQWTDLHEILHRGSPRRRNQLCQLLSQSDSGFRFCVGSNFWLSHSNEMSPLTHGLNYRSACDILFMATSGTNAPMKRRRAWRRQWPGKSDFASFWLYNNTCQRMQMHQKCNIDPLVKY